MYTTQPIKVFLWNLLKNLLNPITHINFSTRATHSPRQLFNDWLMRLDCSASLIWVLKESEIRQELFIISQHEFALWESLYDDPSLQWNLLPVIIIKTLSISRSSWSYAIIYPYILFIVLSTSSTAASSSSALFIISFASCDLWCLVQCNN